MRGGAWGGVDAPARCATRRAQLPLPPTDSLPPAHLRPTHPPLARSAFEELRELRLERATKLRAERLGALAPLAPTLTLLSLAGCKGVGGAGAGPPLAALPSLRSLDLANTAVDNRAWPGELERLSALTFLSLAGTQVGDPACECLARLTGLARLDLSGTGVSPAALPSLNQLTALTEIDLSLTHASSGRGGWGRVCGVVRGCVQRRTGCVDNLRSLPIPRTPRRWGRRPGCQPSR